MKHCRQAVPYDVLSRMSSGLHWEKPLNYTRPGWCYNLCSILEVVLSILSVQGGGEDRGRAADRWAKWRSGGISETGGGQNIHVPRFEFVRSRRSRLGLNARDFNLGGHEVSRVVRLEIGLSVGAVHGGGLLYAKIGLQGEAWKEDEAD